LNLHILTGYKKRKELLPIILFITELGINPDHILQKVRKIQTLFLKLDLLKLTKC